MPTIPASTCCTRASATWPASWGAPPPTPRKSSRGSRPSPPRSRARRSSPKRSAGWNVAWSPRCRAATIRSCWGRSWRQAWSARGRRSRCRRPGSSTPDRGQVPGDGCQGAQSLTPRSEEHTSELQSLAYLVCRLLLEKKKHARRNEEGGYHRDRADQVKHSPPAAESSDSFCLNAHAALVVLLPFFF